MERSISRFFYYYPQFKNLITGDYDWLIKDYCNSIYPDHIEKSEVYLITKQGRIKVCVNKEGVLKINSNDHDVKIPSLVSNKFFSILRGEFKVGQEVNLNSVEKKRLRQIFYYYLGEKKGLIEGLVIKNKQFEDDIEYMRTELWFSYNLKIPVRNKWFLVSFDGKKLDFSDENFPEKLKEEVSVFMSHKNPCWNRIKKDERW